MLSLKTKLASGLATAGLLAASFSPAAALAADVSVTDNGALSHNYVSYNNSSYTNVEQSNVTKVNTVVHQSSNTGGNSQSFNTGDGGTHMETGNASNTVAVSVMGGNNVANLPQDCGCPDDTSITISDNGAYSHNAVKVSNKKTLKVDQHSYTGVNTHVHQKSNTGKNKQWFNTGDGHTTMRTHSATNNASVGVHSGHNRVN